jgi:hypothetical protein
VLQFDIVITVIIYFVACFWPNSNSDGFMVAKRDHRLTLTCKDPLAESCILIKDSGCLVSIDPVPRAAAGLQLLGKFNVHFMICLVCYNVTHWQTCMAFLCYQGQVTLHATTKHFADHISAVLQACIDD